MRTEFRVPESRKAKAGNTQTMIDPTPPATWYSRNWRWLVPSGCGCMLLLAGAIAAVLVTLRLGVIKSSAVYEEALDRARSDPRVISSIGQPVETRWYVLGSIEVDGSGGDADLEVPLSGPRGEGTLYVEGERAQDTWQFRRLEFEHPGGRRTDLLGLAP